MYPYGYKCRLCTVIVKKENHPYVTTYSSLIIVYITYILYIFNTINNISVLFIEY